MFSFLNNQSFLDFVLERGTIPFVVHGNITCTSNFNFGWGIRISPPTYRLKVIGEHPDTHEEQYLNNVFFREMTGETVFPGEIDLPERSREGVRIALIALERWADFLCLANGNPKIQVEVQLPIQAVAFAKRELRFDDLERWAELVNFHSNLPEQEKAKVTSALWWYRKGCTANNYSIFDGYAAYWNCLEILCEVSGSRQREGTEIEEGLQDYFKDKQKIKPGHIIEAYNRYVNYSIASQVKDVLSRILSKAEGDRWAYYCFDSSLAENRLYQIRNDINHGNIHENNENHYTRVYLRGMLLWQLVFRILHRSLGIVIKPEELDVDSVANQILNIPSK